MTSQTLPLNLIPKGVCPRLYVSQYDKGQEWNFDIYAGTEAYTIPSGSTVTIQGTKPDKTGFQYACSFSGNRVTATEQQQMTIIAGEVPAEIRIEKNNEIIATLNFIIAVEKAALADDTVISETDLPLIEEAIEVLGHADELVQRIEGDVTTSGNNALKAEGFAVGQQNGSDVASGSPYYHNSAKYYKEQAANSASTASNKASDASGSASAASGSASSASTNALKAEGFAVGQQNGSDVASGSPYYHNSAKYYKEQAADSASTASTKAGEAAASAQAAAQSAAHLTIDNALSTTSENALQNKVITTTIQNLSTVVSKNGAKNLCPTMNPSDPATLSSWSSYFKINADGSITANGTPSSRVSIASRVVLPAGQYIMKGCPSGGNWYTYRIMFLKYTPSETVVYSDMGSTPTTVTLDEETEILIRVDLYGGYTASNLVYKPMICLKELYDLDPTYEPWAMTNRQLTTDKVGMDLLSEVGAVNMFEYPYSWSTCISSGIAYTDNGDGSISVGAGTVGTSYPSTFEFASNTNWIQKLKGKYVKVIVDGVGTINGNNSNFQFTVYDSNNNNIGSVVLYPDNNRVEQIIYIPTNVDHVYSQIWNKKGATITAYTWKPMICPVKYTGPYVPYAKSNKELTEDVAKLSFKTRAVSGTLNDSATLALDITKGCIPLDIDWSSSAKPSLVSFEYNDSYKTWYARCLQWNGTHIAENSSVAGTLTYIDLR